jgi:UDP:flavonoid glycosyltransferase YjiC (YdhE family)
MSPTLDLASELINQGDDVVFFSSEEFKLSVQNAGAQFVAYKEDMIILPAKQLLPTKFVDDVLSQIRNYQFDYIVYSEGYPFASVIARILDIPSVSSVAVFVPLKNLLSTGKQNEAEAKSGLLGMTFTITDHLKKIRQKLIEKYQSVLSNDMSRLFYNSRNLNIA